jgi:hypothetical protein
MHGKDDLGDRSSPETEINLISTPVGNNTDKRPSMSALTMSALGHAFIERVERLTERILGFLDIILVIRCNSKEIYRLPLRSRLTKQELQKDIYREILAEMRARRDTEFKVVALYLQMCAFVFAAAVVPIFGQSPKLLQTLLATGACLFLTLMWFRVHRRIAYDNSSYLYFRNLADSIEKEWFDTTLASWFQTVGAKSPSGIGYRQTQAMIAFCTLFMDMTIFLLVVVRWLLPAQAACK